ncbi:MAG TPA: VOC family protein [Ktedonobacteraceae bacterium]|nr:VOC family protein [Ktedonobacteraceae bacterium]
MLRKIDNVMIGVNDLTEALNFYSDVFGLKPIWQDQNRGQAGLLFPASDSKIILYTDTEMPGRVEINYLVDDVEAAVQKYVDQGCAVLAEPFDTLVGRGAVIQDPFGVRLSIQDLSKAAVEVNPL